MKFPECFIAAIPLYLELIERGSPFEVPLPFSNVVFRPVMLPLLEIFLERLVSTSHFLDVFSIVKS